MATISTSTENETRLTSPGVRVASMYPSPFLHAHKNPFADDCSMLSSPPVSSPRRTRQQLTLRAEPRKWLSLLPLRMPQCLSVVSISTHTNPPTPSSATQVALQTVLLRSLRSLFPTPPVC